MKHYILFPLFFLTIFSFSQNSQSLEISEHQLAFGTSITINNTTLIFKELSTDSRCPKEVTCIRAGEAIATLEVKIKDQRTKLLELTFFPHGVVSKLTEYLANYNINLENLELLPYPKALSNTSKRDYFIRFKIVLEN